MKIIQNTATQGTWLKEGSERVLRELMQHFDLPLLLQHFAELVKPGVPVQTLAFRHHWPTPSHGPQALAGAAVSSHPAARGTLRLLTSHPFDQIEQRQLAAFTELLQLPLHTAIHSHNACMAGECRLQCDPPEQPAALSPQHRITKPELICALEKGEMTLHYQPKVAMKSGKLVGLEALLRWHHSIHGLLSPEMFIPIAERMGVIGLISRWVLEQVIQQCASWYQAGLLVPIAVNLSGLDLEDRTLPHFIAERLERWQVPATFIELEITETAAITDHEAGLKVLGRLARLGIGVTIDDFGIGYSSLQRLKQLPVSTIKIDKSFVIDAGQGEQDMLFVDTITRLGHGLGMKVVAEGVECRESWDQLAAAGCDMGQGYHISRPLPVDSMTGWLRNGAHCGQAKMG